MVYKLVLLPVFEKDVDEIYGWYASKVNEGLSLRFLDDLLGQLTFIEKNPQSLARYKSNVRKINLTVFPYKVLYKIRHDEVIVFAIFHHKQSAKQFIKRDI